VRHPTGRRYLALLAIAGMACESITDPALPPGATLLTPPAVYARWWAMTEACSGLHGNLSAITWYVTTGADSISDGTSTNLAGYYAPAGNRIVLADTATLSGTKIRHEMLHALLGPSVHGHPRDQFLGRCAGTVDCIGPCITDAGPPPPPDPAAITVDPTALEVTTVLDPVTPRRSIDDGWFTFTILVTNPRTTPVIVNLPTPPEDASAPASFSWFASCVYTMKPCGQFGGVWRDVPAYDPASVTRFAAGETKRFVVDFRVGSGYDGYWQLPGGAYAFIGYYGGRASPGVGSKPDTAVVGP